MQEVDLQKTRTYFGRIKTQDELDKWVQKNIIKYYDNEDIQLLVRATRYRIINEQLQHAKVLR